MKIIQKEKNNLIFFFLFFSFSLKLQCTESFTAFFPANTSSPIGIQYNWIENPLNLVNLTNELNFILAITPSKFLLPDLNASTFAFATNKLLSLNSSIVLHYIHSNVFANYFINLSLNKVFWDNYNLAMRLSSEIINVKGFNSFKTFSIDFFLEYLIGNFIKIGCKFGNLLSKTQKQIFGFGASYLISKEFLCGIDINIFLKQFLVYKFFTNIKVSNSLDTELMYSTNPSIVSLSIGLELSELLDLVLALQYNTKLGITQTFGIKLCF